MDKSYVVITDNSVMEMYANALRLKISDLRVELRDLLVNEKIAGDNCRIMNAREDINNSGYLIGLLGMKGVVSVALAVEDVIMLRRLLGGEDDE